MRVILFLLILSLSISGVSSATECNKESNEVLRNFPSLSCSDHNRFAEWLNKSSLAYYEKYKYVDDWQSLLLSQPQVSVEIIKAYLDRFSLHSSHYEHFGILDYLPQEIQREVALASFKDYVSGGSYGSFISFQNCWGKFLLENQSLKDLAIKLRTMDFGGDFNQSILKASILYNHSLISADEIDSGFLLGLYNENYREEVIFDEDSKKKEIYKFLEILRNNGKVEYHDIPFAPSL